MQLLLLRASLRSLDRLLLGLIALVALGGCPKGQVTQAPSPATVGVVTALSNAEESEVTAVPSSVEERITREITRRGLTPRAVSGPVANFENQRTSAARIALSVEAASGTDAVLLLDATARFSAQVNGRYRWSVYGTVHLVPDGVPENALVKEFQIPAHLIYAQQDEDDAVAEVAPILARHVAQLIEDWLAAGQ